MTATRPKHFDGPAWVPVRFAAGAIDLRADAHRLPARLSNRVWAATDPVSRYRMSMYLVPQPAPPGKKYTVTDTVLLIRPPAPTSDPAAAVIASTTGDKPAMHPLMMALYGLRTLLDHREKLVNRQTRSTLTPVLVEMIAQEWARVPALHAAIAHRTLDGPSATVDLGAALEFTSQGITSPDLMGDLWAAGILGSDLKRWLRAGWPPEQIVAWASVLSHPPSRDWVEHGYGPAEVQAWEAAGVARFADLLWWRQVSGWDDPRIADWAFAQDPARAEAWQATKMTPAAARRWAAWGVFTPEQARTARACALTLVEAQALFASVAEPPPVAAEMLHAYLDLLVRSLGADLHTVYACIQAGISPEEAATRLSAGALDGNDLAVLAALRGNDTTWEQAVTAAEEHFAATA